MHSFFRWFRKKLQLSCPHKFGDWFVFDSNSIHLHRKCEYCNEYEYATMWTTDGADIVTGNK